MQRWYSWLRDKKRKGEKTTEEKITSDIFPVLRREQASCTESRNQQRGEEVLQVLDDLQEDAMPMMRCEEKSKEWTKHWQCVRLRAWKNEDLRSFEGMPQLEDESLERTARSYKGATAMECGGFHQRFPTTCRKQRKRGGEVLRVRSSGKWSPQACTMMFFLSPRSVTSERPIAFLRALEVEIWKERRRFGWDTIDGRSGGAERSAWEAPLEMDTFDYRTGEMDQGAITLVLDLSSAFECQSLPRM